MMGRPAEQSKKAALTSYEISFLLFKKNKPFLDGELVKDCIAVAARHVCPEQVDDLSKIGPSRQTVTRRAETIGTDLKEQLKDLAKNLEQYSFALDGSTDEVDTAQLAVFVRGVDDNFNVTEELAGLCSLKETTTGQDIFRELENTMQALDLDYNKLVGITTDGAPSMAGVRSGLVGLVVGKIASLGLDQPHFSHYMLHQQKLCAK